MCRGIVLSRLKYRMLLLLLTGVISACGLLTSEPYAFKGMEFEDPVKAPEFSLIDQNRNLVNLSDLRGKVVLMFFGFTNCPDACPATLGAWKQVYELLGDETYKVSFMMITVDPERDTPEILKKHLALFNPDFIGLHGTLEEIKEVAKDYNIFFEKEDIGSAAGYSVGHSTLSYLIDPVGNLILGHRSYEASPIDIASDIKHILSKPSSQINSDGEMMLLCESGCMINLPVRNQ